MAENLDGDPPSKLRIIIKTLLELIGLLSLWFAPSIGLTLLNKWMFNEFHGGFAFPLSATLTHMTCNSLVSFAAMKILQTPEPCFTWRTYFTTVVPIGFFTVLDIGCSNLAFLLLSVSLITIVKSASPFFILIFGFALGLEKVRCSLIMVILCICGGTALATSHALQSDGEDVLLGVSLVLLSCVASGARWAMTQLMLQSGIEKMSPLTCLRYTAPVCVICLVPVVIFRELSDLSQSKFVTDHIWTLETAGLLLCGVCLSFTLVIAEYAIIARFSAVTMTLSGVVKELLTIWLGTVIYNDEITPRTWLGAFVIICGVLFYSRLKWLQREEDEQDKAADIGGELVLEEGVGHDLVGTELSPLDEQNFFMPLGAPGEVFFEEEEEDAGLVTPRKKNILDAGKDFVKAQLRPRVGSCNTAAGYSQVAPGAPDL